MSNQDYESDFFELAIMAFFWGWAGTVIVIVGALILGIWTHGVLGLENHYTEPRQATLEAQTRAVVWSKMHSCIQDKSIIKRFDYAQDRVDLYCETRKDEANEILTRLIDEGMTLKEHHAEGFAIHSGWQVLAGLGWLAWFLISPILMLCVAIFGAAMAIYSLEPGENNGKNFVVGLCIAFPPFATFALYMVFSVLDPGAWGPEFTRVTLALTAILSALAYVGSRKNAKKEKEEREKRERLKKHRAKVEATEEEKADQ